MRQKKGIDPRRDKTKKRAGMRRDDKRWENNRLHEKTEEMRHDEIKWKESKKDKDIRWDKTRQNDKLSWDKKKEKDRDGKRWDKMRKE